MQKLELNTPEQPVLTMISPWSPWGQFANYLSSTLASRTWEAAARVAYFPIAIPRTITVTRVWWVNGATVTGGATVEAGLYSDAGSGAYKPATKLLSASAVQGTLNQVQFVNLVANKTIYRGLYWLALMMSSATNTTAWGVAPSAAFDAFSRYQEASANPLPSTATPAASASASMYLFGISTNTVT